MTAYRPELARLNPANDTNSGDPGASLPGSNLDVEKMPGHWLLARLGKRVLRPGGLGLTRSMLERLAIGPDDTVVEFAPGLGVTARMILDRRPGRYIGIERDGRAANWTKRQLPSGLAVSVVVGTADAIDLADHAASVVVGEAMLTMHPQVHKQRIVAEAFRVLRPGGRYGIHELCIYPDDMPGEHKRTIDKDLSAAIHVGARPLASKEWRELLESAGFRMTAVGYAPMHLLRPTRLVQDEGWLGALRIVWNVIADRKARRRVLAMRRVFERHEENLQAIFLVGEKPLD